MKRCNLDFYLRDDVVLIAKQLLGKELIVSRDGKNRSGIITETEAYAGITDRASHAWNNRRTKRTETMYHQGGCSYVYLCYGMHHLFNVVTSGIGDPQAVLIRAIIPKKGKDPVLSKRINGNGPGRLTSILGITTKDNNVSLIDGHIAICETAFIILENDIVAGKRIGVEYAGEDALLEYRFTLSEQIQLEIKKNI